MSFKQIKWTKRTPPKGICSSFQVGFCVLPVVAGTRATADPPKLCGAAPAGEETLQKCEPEIKSTYRPWPWQKMLRKVSQTQGHRSDEKRCKQARFHQQSPAVIVLTVRS